jgi:4-hydroxybenzoate polyprenyltransferase
LEEELIMATQVQTTPRVYRSQGLGMLFALTAQYILGLLLFVGALVLLIRSITYKNRTWMVAGSIGLAGILVAIYGGVRFIPTQNDPYSLLMSIAFIVSLLAYVWGLFKSKF